jgi:ribonuclease P protein component
MPTASLNKKERLKSRKEIDFLFKEGKSFPLTPFRVYYRIKTIAEGDTNIYLQAGVGVSSRNFKKAVDRNRIKRLSREAYRLQKQSLLDTLVAANKEMRLFIIYTGRELPQFELVKEKTAIILKRLQTLVHENNTQAS